ncbi:MAG TPA: hypothetical protein VHW43_03020 [Puia sp.]|jgi:hypothetical protein|nr:hypothetical protein [Puia sp.]
MTTLFVLLFFACLVLFVIGLFNPAKSLFWDKKTPTKKKSSLVYGLLIVLFLFLIGANGDHKQEAVTADNASAAEGASGSTPSTASAQQKEDKAAGMPTEQKLAVLDAGTFVDTTDIKVKRMRSLLDDLSEKYAEPRDTIAEYTSKAQGVLADKGVQESCLDILENMNKVDKLENTHYKDAVTLYVMLRAK